MVEGMQIRTPACRPGRPRSAAADTAILAATREALVELGWSKLTLGDVATRAGVAKTTLYRRWAGKNELVVDAVAELFGELELPDRGSLAADIEGVVLQFAAILARPEAKSGLMAAVAESTRDDALRERIRASIVDPQKGLVLEGRARAQARGELPRRPTRRRPRARSTSSSTWSRGRWCTAPWSARNRPTRSGCAASRAYCCKACRRRPSRPTTPEDG